MLSAGRNPADRPVAVALLDRTIGERRPGCVEYAARTSAFIPMPLRRTRR